MFQTYQPSGRFGLLTLPLWLAGLVIAAVLAYLYQRVLPYIPWIFINFVLTIGLGLVLGMFASKVVELGKVRNVMVAALIGLSLTLGALSAKYFFQHRQMIQDWINMTMVEKQVPEANRADVERFVRKNLTFMEHINARTEKGWEIGGRGGGIPIKGSFVYLTWVLEAIIVAYSAIAAPTRRAGEPFNEKLNEWASEEEVVMMLPVTEAEMVSQIKAATSVDELLQIPIPKTDESHEFAKYRVNSIEGEELEDAYLSVDLLTISLNSEGQEETKETPLVKLAVLSSAQRQQLQENASLLQEAMEEYREEIERERAAAADADAAAKAAADEIDSGDDEAASNNESEV